MSQNNELHQVCKAWLRASLYVLQSKSPSVFYYRVLPHDKESQMPVPNDNYLSMYLNYRNEIMTLPEFDTIMELVIKTPKLLSILCVDRVGHPITSPEMQRFWLSNYCDRFILTYLSITKEVNFKSAEFENVYEKFEEFIYSSEPLKALWLISFRNLTSEGNTVPLESGVFLRQTTVEEKEQAVRNASFMPDIPNVILEIHHTIERTSVVQQQEAADIAEAIVLALRLMKGNPVGVDTFQWSVLDQPFWLGGGQISRKHLLPFTYYGEPYVLTEDDATTLQVLWPKAKKAYTDPKLSTAINRLEDAYSRTKNEDKLIDYWTALETLFLPSDEYIREMGDMVALAVSFYIGRSDAARNSIREDIKRSHALRSYFVHGNRGKQKSDLNEMVQKTGEHLRCALRLMIEEEE